MSTRKKITITEALAEIKLIQKKLLSKTKYVCTNLIRFKHEPDRLGDSTKALTEEIQSIKDLYGNIVRIRTEISKANIVNTIRIDDDEMTISDWLTWKREVSALELSFYNNIRDNLKQAMDRAAQQPQMFKDDQGQTQLAHLVLNLDYPEYSKKSEKVQEKLDKLDGLLSLKNATIIVEI